MFSGLMHDRIFSLYNVKKTVILDGPFAKVLRRGGGNNYSPRVKSAGGEWWRWGGATRMEKPR